MRGPMVEEGQVGALLEHEVQGEGRRVSVTKSCGLLGKSWERRANVRTRIEG